MRLYISLVIFLANLKKYVFLEFPRDGLDDKTQRFMQK